MLGVMDGILDVTIVPLFRERRRTAGGIEQLFEMLEASLRC